MFIVVFCFMLMRFSCLCCVSQVLKATGLREYMEGSRQMQTYEYYRQCRHDTVEMDFVLMAKPAPIPIPPEEVNVPIEAYKVGVLCLSLVSSFNGTASDSM